MMKRFDSAIVAVLLIALLSGCNSLSRAAYRGNLEGVKKQVAAGANVNQYDRWGWTPIIWAIYYNYYDIVKYLLENKADPNLRSMHAYGSIAKDSTPLIVASYYGHTGIVSLLLRYGADKKVENSQGETPFSVAEKYNFMEIMDLLGGKGANRIAIQKKTAEDPVKEETSHVILLNDGSKIVGTIVSQTRTTVTIRTRYNTMTIEKDKIKEMKYK